MIDTNETLRVSEGYSHPKLSDQMLEHCAAVLIGLQSNGGSMTKREMHDFTGLGYGLLETVRAILRYGVLPAYKCTLTTSRDGQGIYTLTSKPEEIADYSNVRLIDSIARIKSEVYVARVWVAVSVGRTDTLAVMARGTLRRLEFILAELEETHTKMVKAIQSNQRAIARQVELARTAPKKFVFPKQEKEDELV